MKHAEGGGEAGRNVQAIPDEDSRRPASPLHQESSPRTFDVPWTLQDVAWGTVVFGAIFGSFAVAMAIVRVVETTFVTQGSRYLDGVLLLILESALIVPVWLFAIRKHGVGWDKLGFRPFNWLAGCGLAAFLLLGSFVINAIWAGLLAQFNLRVQPDVLPVFGGGVAGVTIAFLAAGVVAPLVEETFFRGFLLPALAQRYRFWVAALIDGLVFAFIHFTPTAIAPLFVLGVLLCVLYRFTGSLWPSILMHATMNTLAVFVAYAVEIGVVPAPTGP